MTNHHDNRSLRRIRPLRSLLTACAATLLALSATAPYDTFISIFAGAYVLVLVWGMNNFEKLPDHGLSQSGCGEKKAARPKPLASAPGRLARRVSLRRPVRKRP